MTIGQRKSHFINQGNGESNHLPTILYKIMKYNITLEHEDFVLLLDLLKRAQGKGLTTWNAASFICKNTKVEEKEL